MKATQTQVGWDIFPGVEFINPGCGWIKLLAQRSSHNAARDGSPELSNPMTTIITSSQRLRIVFTIFGAI